MKLTFEDSPALKNRSRHYPYGNKVPKLIKMLKTVNPDFITSLEDIHTLAKKDEHYFAWTNSHGAVAAIMLDGNSIGVKPGEFEVVAWHDLSKLEVIHGVKSNAKP